MTAGQAYRDALVQLGLVPAYLGWGWDPSAKEWLLVLVTSILEAGGPLKLNELLFKAYNAKATPKEISPFIVRVFSPEIVPPAVWLLGERNVTLHGVLKGTTEMREISGIDNIQQTFMGLELEMVNSYPTPPEVVKRALARSFHRRHQDWQKFKRNVEKLAA